VRVAGVLKRAVRSLQSVAARDEIFLLSAHGRDVPQIIGSVEKLTQAVINLISNSLKFTPKKGLISVGAQIVRNNDAGDAIVVTVTDTGMGIKADEVQKIWDKYAQSGNKSLRGGGMDARYERRADGRSGARSRSRPAVRHGARG
jgi:signal transduction histidine kinase